MLDKGSCKFVILVFIKLRFLKLSIFYLGTIFFEYGIFTFIQMTFTLTFQLLENVYFLIFSFKERDILNVIFEIL